MADFEAMFAEVYESHFRSVHDYCRRRVSSDRVEDLVAETFLTAWRKIDQMPRGDESLPWLYGVAYRVVMHQWRGSFRRRRLVGKLSSLGVESAPTPEDFIVADEESRRVLVATSRLKQTDQEILRLSLWEELPHAEIAEVLGLRPDAARQRLSRALKNLTKQFNKTDSKNADSALLRKEVPSDN